MYTGHGVRTARPASSRGAVRARRGRRAPEWGAGGAEFCGAAAPQNSGPPAPLSRRQWTGGGRPPCADHAPGLFSGVMCIIMYRIILYHIISYYIISYDIISYHIIDML